MIIGRNFLGLRPYYIDNKEVNNIIFYDDNGIITEVKQGWLEGSQSQKFIFLKDVEQIDIDTPIKRIKVNLTRKENFYIPVKNYIDESCYCLYLYVDGEKIKVENLGEFVFDDSEISTMYSDKLFIKINDISFYCWKKPINKIIEKPEYLKAKDIVEEMKKDGVSMSEFSVLQLLKKYEVEKKC